MPTKAKKVEAPEVRWPDSINLNEKLPPGHDREGYPRYAVTRNGTGRMDMTILREVPDHLVAGALAALEQASVTA